MNADKGGSYLREPSISEGELKSRIEALIADAPLNEHTVVERRLSIDDEVTDLNLVRARKEIEASLGHRIADEVRVTMRFNPAWSTFDVRQLEFALPGTESLIARADYDPESDSYASYLYDEYDQDPKKRQQLARKPIQTSTIAALLQNDPIVRSVTAETQSELLIELFQSTRSMDLTIRQSAVLFEEEMPGEVFGSCSIERTQEYGENDILDVIKFINQIQMPESAHARVVTIYSSQHGSSITAEELSEDSLRDTATKRTIEFDYETLEKLIAQVDKAHELMKDAKSD